MTILLVAEHDNATLSGQTAKALTAASQIGGDVHVLVAGKGADAVAKEAAALADVAKVLHADGDAFEHQLAEPVADLVVSLAGDYDTLIAASTSNGKNIMPRVAALLDVMQISDIVEVLSANSFKRPIYAGNAIQTLETSDATKVITVRTAAFAAAGDGGSASIEAISSDVGNDLSGFIGMEASDSERPDLTAARVVISGGRALGSAENFDKLINPVADKLGAAIGASRAAVDAGYAPNDMQVGQTGKIVAPELYIACGISGAIQHVAGMKDSRVIVAINKDGECPIFQIADYGLIGDIFEILPELEKAL